MAEALLEAVDKAAGIDRDKMEALELLAQGKRNLLCGEVPKAVNQLQEVCQRLADKFGETADEVADAYFYYGKALLELSRMESGVLGNALQGIEDDDAEKSDEKSSTDDVVEKDDLTGKSTETAEERAKISDEVLDAMLETDEEVKARLEKGKADAGLKGQKTEKDDIKIEGKEDNKEDSKDVDMQTDEKEILPKTNPATTESKVKAEKDVKDVSKEERKSAIETVKDTKKNAEKDKDTKLVGKSGKENAEKADKKDAKKADEKEAKKADEKEAKKADEKEAKKADEKEAKKADEKEAKKADEKEAKKADEKEAKKADEKDEKEVKKADEKEVKKADEKDEKEAKKADEKEAKKADEKEAKKADKEEEKEAKKADEKETKKADKKEAKKADEKETKKADEKEAKKADEKEAKKAGGKDAKKAGGKDANEADEDGDKKIKVDDTKQGDKDVEKKDEAEKNGKLCELNEEDMEEGETSQEEGVESEDIGDEENEVQEGTEGGETENDTSEGEKKDGEGSADIKEEEDVSNLQLAWEMLELSKIIFKRNNSRESKLKLADSFLKLGEVGMETEQYETAISDFKECLRIQKELLEPDDRSLAETYYQLGLACTFHALYDDAVDYYRKASSTIEARIANLKKIIDGMEGKGKEKADPSDPLVKAQKEVKDLEDIIPDIMAKIEDVLDEKRNADQVKQMVKENLASSIEQTSTTSTGFGQTEQTTSHSGAVQDITHLVRKRKKVDDDTEDALKKAKTQENGSGDKVNGTTEVNGKAPLNGQASKSEVSAS